MKINKKNQELLKKYETQHIKEKGKMPYETAITNLIHYSCLNKTYKVNYEDIEIYDVIMWSNFTNDVFFLVVIDEDGDSVTTVKCSENGELLYKTINL